MGYGTLGQGTGNAENAKCQRRHIIIAYIAIINTAQYDLQTIEHVQCILALFLLVHIICYLAGIFCETKDQAHACVMYVFSPRARLCIAVRSNLDCVSWRRYICAATGVVRRLA